VTFSLRRTRSKRGRQRPILEGSAVAQVARLPRQHRNVVPGVIGSLVAAESAVVDDRGLVLRYEHLFGRV